MGTTSVDPSRLAELVGAADLAIVTVDAAMTVTGWFGAAEKLYGWTAAEIIGRSVDTLSPEGQAASDRAFFTQVAADEEIDIDRTRLRKDGTTFVAEVRARALWDDGENTGTISLIRDVTETVELKARAARAERRFQSAFHGAAIAMVMCDLTGAIIEANEAYRSLTTTAGLETDGRVLDIIEPSGRPSVAAAMGTLATAPGRFEGIEVPALGRPDHILNVSVSPVDDGVDRPPLALVQLLDISDQLRIQAELAEIATIDPLTRAFNRSCLEPLLHSLASGTQIGVLFLDLDRFKEVNDTEGHGAGDAILEAVGARLDAIVRDSDYVIRYGGDEFVIVCPGLADAGAAGRLGDRLRTSVAAPVGWNGIELRVTASVGAVLTLADTDTDFDAVIARADQAMYAAKAAGRDSTVTES